MTTITPELLAEIRAKAEKATPGPWQSEHPMFDPEFEDESDIRPRYIASAVATTCDCTAVAVLRHEQEDDAAHIARVDPPTVLALVAALEDAQRERDANATRIRNMEQALRETGAECDARHDENVKLRSLLHGAQVAAVSLSEGVYAALKDTTHA